MQPGSTSTSASASPAPREYRGTVVRRSSGSRHWSKRIRNVRRWIYGRIFRCWYWGLPKLPLWLISFLSRTLVVPFARLRYWRRAEKNLIRVYGDELDAQEREQILKGVFGSVASLAVELAGALKRGPEMFRNRVGDTGLERCLMDIEQSSKRGWIGVSGHLGNWELMASWAANLPGTRSCCVVAKRLPNPHLNKIVHEARQHLGLETLYRDDPPTLVVRRLKQGCRLGIVPDQDVPSLPGVFIDFLGHTAYTPTGPARLALAADVPLIPMAFLRKKEGQGFLVIHDEPIYPDRSRPKREEVLRLTRAWSKALENMIHKHKDQWAWFHRRWRTTPEKLEGLGRAQV
jgi:lauroyl/myristoyl acyltransferase